MLKKNVLMVIALATMVFYTVPAYAAKVCQAPTDGPGAPVYSDFTGVKEPESTGGTGPQDYIIYEPNPDDVTGPLPVIVYLHGFGWWPNPNSSYQFVEHLVKKGHIVIWPYYENMFVKTENYVTNAGNAISEALDHIVHNPGHHAQPAYDAAGNVKYALVGHSAGAITAANVAATYTDFDSPFELPAPKALVCMHPGRGQQDEETGEYSIPIENYGGIDENTYMLIISGDVDTTSGAHGRFIWDLNVNNVRAERKNWILVKSDDRGYPDDLMATHLNPVGEPADIIDCHDWNGYWKWATALCNLGFNGADEAFALGNTTQQRDMGQWIRPYYQTVIGPVYEPDICYYDEEYNVWSPICSTLAQNY